MKLSPARLQWKSGGTRNQGVERRITSENTIAFLLLTLPVMAQEVTGIDLIKTPAGTLVSELTDGAIVSLEAVGSANLSVKAVITGEFTDVDFRVQSDYHGVDYRYTDRSAPWTLCGEYDFAGTENFRRCHGIGYGGEYVLTVTPYNGTTAGTQKQIGFTLVMSERQSPNVVIPKKPKAPSVPEVPEVPETPAPEVPESPVTEYVTPAECPRGGRLVSEERVSGAMVKTYQCSNGATRVERISVEEVKVYSRRVTVCSASEPRMVVIAVGEDGHRAAEYHPVPDPVPAGAKVVDVCVAWTEFLCDEQNYCTEAQ